MIIRMIMTIIIIITTHLIHKRHLLHTSCKHTGIIVSKKGMPEKSENRSAAVISTSTGFSK
jgi:hypothetical protein